jgi:hypothetical protein
MAKADDHQLLLYIAAKVARLDAITSSIHNILWKDLQPEDERVAAQRRWIIQALYNKNIDAERIHLKTQFPEDYEFLDQYITLGEREHIDQTDQLVRDILESRIDPPEAFKPPPDDATDTKDY